ncbi:MAG: ABC transporter substrate-binding protein [Actinomycetes bacterium]|jgi:branched-chain amino acid transport system substrate-binding protein
MKFGRKAQIGAAVAAVALGLTACGGGSINTDTSTAPTTSASTSASSTALAGTVKIGFVSPQTGPLAAFGESDTFVINYMNDYFAKNPIVIGGQNYGVQIIVKDAESDSAKAAKAAADLINNDGVDIVMAAGTPDIVNPVADACEANATPCITDNAPWQPYVLRGKDGIKSTFHWGYHFFWGLEDVAATFTDFWSQVPNNKKVGGLFPNDPDGQAWSANVPVIVKADGYTVTFPPLYPNLTQDFTAQISSFKKSNDEVLTGVPIPPDFTTFWKQAKQQGYNPKIASVGKALLFPSSVDALGDLGQNLSTEVWWHPSWPTTSSLTGITPQEFCDLFEATTGKQWTQPIGYVEALFEVAVNALVTNGSTDKESLAKTLSALSTDTIVGKVAWSPTAGPTSPTPNVAKTPLAGGQWRLTNGGAHKYELVLTSNKVATSEGLNIPLGGKEEALPVK